MSPSFFSLLSAATRSSCVRVIGVAGFITACGAAQDRVLEQPVERHSVKPNRPAPAQLTAEAEQAGQTDAPPPAATETVAARSLVEGQVAGRTYKLTHAIALHGFVHAGEPKPEALVFVVSDRADMCEHLQQGTLPRGSNMLAVTLLNAPNGYLPQTRFVPGGEMGDEELPMASILLRTLDDRCRILPSLGATGAEGLYGHATLLQFDAQGAALELYAEMMRGPAAIGTIGGQVQATRCEAPLLFEQAQAFHTGIVKPEHCVDQAR